MFVRRFSAMPSAAVLLMVSGVVIVDSPPPVPAQAAPFGKILVVGELEDGPFNTPTDILTATDQQTTFGLFGYRYGSSKHQHACAQRSGGSEPWNGNAWVQTAKLKFRALAFCRVDTSIGEVSLTPRAFVQGAIKAPFALDNGLTFIFTPNGGGAVTVTFAAAAATHTGAAGTFNTFAGGEVLQLAIDDGSTFDVQFQPGDTSLAAIVSRINTVYGQTIASQSSGQLRLTSLKKGTASKVKIVASAVATTLGLTASTYTGSGDAADISQTTFAELKTKVDAASALIVMTTSESGYPRLVSKLGGTGTLQVGAGTANSALGFSQGATATTAALSADVSIPAGSRCYDGASASTRVVTMQTTTAAKGSTAAVLLKVRPAVDDGSYVGQSSGAIDTLEDKPGDLEWSVTNVSALSDALTAAQLDARYLTAIDATVGVGNDVTRRINGIVSARQSDAIRARVKQNAIDTSASGHFGRRGFISPPNGSSAATIISGSAPGVSAYRAEEVSLAAPGVRCVLQEMIDGGYSTDGIVVRHADALLASRWSVLAPGYNPGQVPEEAQYRFDSAIFFGLETSASSWDINTYAAMKTAGVCAAVFDKDTGLTFEQGITTVDPSAEPARVDIARKTLADFIGDTCALLARPQAKRQGTTRRRESTKDALEGFLDTLLGDTVAEYKVTITTSGMPKGVVRYDIFATPVQSDDVIVFNLSVGPNAVALARA